MTIVRTPVVYTAPLQLSSRLWRKQLMKKGTLHYEGQQIDIDDTYLNSLVDDFRSGTSMDVVSFFYANDANQHNMSPSLRKGRIVDIENTDDGLYGLLRLASDADGLVQEDKDFGVSVDIRHGHTDGNGVHHPVQLRHVLGTYDPVWTGLRPWEAVEEIAASNTADQVIDFTAITLAEGDATNAAAKEAGMSTLTKEQVEKLKSTFSEDQIAVLGDVFGVAQAPAPGSAPAAAGTDPAADAGKEPAELELSPEDLAEIEAIAAQYIDDTAAPTPPAGAAVEPPSEEPAAPAGEVQPVGAGVQASNVDTSALQLANEAANARIRDLEQSQQRLQLANDAKDFDAERDQLARQFGVPTVITDKLRPLLEGAGRTVQLANSEKTADAGALVRDALKELATIGFLDLSNPTSTPHEADQAKKEADELSTLTDQALAQIAANRT